MRTERSQQEHLAGGPALFRLVRFWSRRWAAGAAQSATGDSGQLGHILVLEAIEASAKDGTAAIVDVALQLGLDRSNASRMLSEAVAAGLVRKSASPQDARRTTLQLTPAGQTLLAQARTWQEEAFAKLVADWAPADARRLAGYLVRLASQLPSEPQEESG